MTQISSTNIHSSLKELHLNPSKFSLNDLIIDSASKAKLVYTSTLNQCEMCTRHNLLLNFTKIKPWAFIPICCDFRVSRKRIHTNNNITHWQKTTIFPSITNKNPLSTLQLFSQTHILIQITLKNLTKTNSLTNITQTNSKPQ